MLIFIVLSMDEKVGFVFEDFLMICLGAVLGIRWLEFMHPTLQHTDNLNLNPIKLSHSST